MTTVAQRQQIGAAIARIAGSAIPQAVVDYGPDFAKRGASVRYGTRDLRHVAIYGLAVVALNDAGKPHHPVMCQVYPSGHADDEAVTIYLRPDQGTADARVLVSHTYRACAVVAHVVRPAPDGGAYVTLGQAREMTRGDNT